jgi:hypothetical protein
MLQVGVMVLVLSGGHGKIPKPKTDTPHNCVRMALGGNDSKHESKN